MEEEAIAFSIVCGGGDSRCNRPVVFEHLCYMERS
jgi:hypothetical protein